MKKKFIAFLLTTLVGVAMVGCGQANTAQEPKQNENTEKQETTVTSEQVENKAEGEQSTQPATEENSKELSGKVVVYMPSPSGLNEKYVEAFKEETGVDVELFEGTTGKILARLEAEKDNPVADVVVLASWSDGLSLEKSGILQSYEPKNIDKVYDGWVDKDSMLFGTSASAVGVIYNTTLIENLEADWSELASDEYKDMIAIPDPEKSGACKDFLSGYFSAFNNDWSTWEALANNGLVVPGANKAALEAVTTGEKAILIAGVDYNAYSSINKGEPLAIYYPKSGTVINPRPAMILKSSANIENAQAFVDFLLSDTAQKLVADAYLLPGRSDITCDKRTNVADIPTFDIDWSWMMDNADEIAAKLNALCQ